MTGTIIAFPVLRCRRSALSTSEYPPNATVARVHKHQSFPPRYKVEGRIMGIGVPEGWPLGNPDTDFNTVGSFLETWRSTAWAEGRSWILEDRSGHFGRFAGPHRAPDGVLIFRPIDFEGLCNPASGAILPLLLPPPEDYEI